MVDLARDRFLSAMRNRIEQIDAIEVRDGAEVIRDEAPQSIRERKVDELGFSLRSWFVRTLRRNAHFFACSAVSGPMAASIFRFFSSKSCCA